jgi:ribonuclease Z
MIRVTFLGTGGALPSVIRNVSGVMVEREGESLLFDCGEGIQRQMMRYGVGFRWTTSISRTTTPITPSGCRACFARWGCRAHRTDPSCTVPPVPLHLGELVHLGIATARSSRSRSSRFNRATGWTAASTRSSSGRCTRVRAVSYALVERDRLGRFDPERARALGIPEGPLWGKIHKGESVTARGPRGVTEPSWSARRARAARWSIRATPRRRTSCSRWPGPTC